MKVGDLVVEKETRLVGIVERVDKDFYGATQAFKVYKSVPRGKCIRPNMVDGIGPTKRGKRDRVLVCWPDKQCEYLESTELEVITEEN
tara:strand:+ start:160 stop:423 length:264 start_codon:yes stop_codon:yes gene_type:complete